MLRNWMTLCTVLIVFSLMVVPAGEAQAYAGEWRGNFWRPYANQAYEPDNTAAQAKVITNGTSQTRGIVPKTDVDWVKFQLATASAVVLETSGSLPADTRLRLYYGNLTPIEFSDDEGSGYYSYIDRVCGVDPLAAGTYYVRVEEYLQDSQIQSYNLSFTAGPCPGEIVDIYAGALRQGANADLQGSSLLPVHGASRRSFAGLNRGPLQMVNRANAPLIAGERVIYNVNGVSTSFSEMMALPEAHLNNIYWLPWYNNASLDSEVRIANATTTAASVQVFVGTIQVFGSPFTVAAGTTVKKTFAGVNNGPLKIVSNTSIVASVRVIYKVNGVPVSYSEMMAVPNTRVDIIYWLPWYNNVGLSSELRIANITATPANIQVLIGGAPVLGGSFVLPANTSVKKSYAGVNNGPVQIISDQNIVVSERVIYTVNGAFTSYSEMMGFPNNQVDTTYWLPWYNQVGLDTELRIANLGGSQAGINIYIGGTLMTGSPFPVAAGASLRKNFANINSGPVKIVSNQPIVAAERVILKVNNVPTSFSEMMALPNGQLNPVFWLPLYNNVGLDSQLRFAVP